MHLTEFRKNYFKYNFEIQFFSSNLKKKLIKFQIMNFNRISKLCNFIQFKLEFLFIAFTI